MEYLLAITAALLLGAGFVIQQDVAQRAPRSHFLSVRLAGDVLSQRRWLMGLGLMVAGQILSAWVIDHIVLSLAEPLLATNLLFALLLAGPVSRQPVNRSEIIGTVLLIAGVTSLSLSHDLVTGPIVIGRPSYWPLADRKSVV